MRAWEDGGWGFGVRRSTVRSAHDSMFVDGYQGKTGENQQVVGVHRRVPFSLFLRYLVDDSFKSKCWTPSKLSVGGFSPIADFSLRRLGRPCQSDTAGKGHLLSGRQYVLETRRSTEIALPVWLSACVSSTWKRLWSDWHAQQLRHCSSATATLADWREGRRCGHSSIVIRVSSQSTYVASMPFSSLYLSPQSSCRWLGLAAPEPPPPLS